jgi:hypothetical protein
MAKDLLISLEDRPGEGARLGEALGNAGVNIQGLCALTHEGQATVHLLVDNAATARSALDGAGVKVEGETDMLVLDLPGNVDTPGTFGQMARRLADAGINISLAYIATKNRAALATSDNERARQLLETTP